MILKDKVENKYRGRLHDIFLDKDGNVIEDRGWDNNVVVNDASTVIAALMAGYSAYGGAQYWAVGQGLSSWDTNPATPTANDHSLVSECFRKPITSVAFAFIDSNGNVTAQPTRTVQITIVIAADEANGFTLREMGVYGGNATATAGSGILINHKTHAKIEKNDTFSVQRVLQLTF